MNKKFSYIVIFTLFTLLFSACTPVENTRGNLISDTRLQKIVPNETTRYELRQIWGPPSAVAPFSDGERWYYIGQKTEVMGIFKKETVDRKVIRVDFDDAGIVKQIAPIDVSEAKDIDPNQRKTSTAGKEFTVIQQFVGNLGRFNAASAANKNNN